MPPIISIVVRSPVASPHPQLHKITFQFFSRHSQRPKYSQSVPATTLPHMCARVTTNSVISCTQTWILFLSLQLLFLLLFLTPKRSPRIPFHLFRNILRFRPRTSRGGIVPQDWRTYRAGHGFAFVPICIRLIQIKKKVFNFIFIWIILSKQTKPQQPYWQTSLLSRKTLAQTHFNFCLAHSIYRQPRNIALPYTSAHVTGSGLLIYTTHSRAEPRSHASRCSQKQQHRVMPIWWGRFQWPVRRPTHYAQHQFPSQESPHMTLDHDRLLPGVERFMICPNVCALPHNRWWQIIAISCLKHFLSTIVLERKKIFQFFYLGKNPLHILLHNKSYV